MTLRALVIELLASWARRRALRAAPSPAEIERLKAKVAQRKYHHREVAPLIDDLKSAVTQRLAAEMGRQFSIGRKS